MIIRNLILPLLVVWSSLSFGQDVETLLQQTDRPSMEQVREVAPQIELDFDKDFGLTKQDVYLGNRGDANLHFKYEFWLKTLIDEGPQFIATLEKAFPGGTWVFIGRDSAAIADMVEAFYLSIGQTGRVARIGMSKETLANATPEALYEMLRSTGYHLSKTTHPFILIDTVSQGFGRQGRSLIQSVYQRAANRQYKMGDLIRKFNMIGIIVSTFKGTPNPVQNSDAVLAQQEAFFNTTRVTDYGANVKVLTYAPTVGQGLFGESGYEHYTAAWHGSYGPLEKRADGKVLAQPKTQFPRQYKLAVLKFQKAIWDRVKSTAFTESVFSFAKQLGYEFPIARPEHKVLQKNDPKLVRELERKFMMARAADGDHLVRPHNSNLFHQNMAELDKLLLRLSPAGQLNWRLVFGSNEEQIKDWFLKAVEQEPHAQSRYGLALLKRLRVELQNKILFTDEGLTNVLSSIMRVAKFSNEFINEIELLRLQNSAANRIFVGVLEKQHKHFFDQVWLYYSFKPGICRQLLAI